MGGKYKDNTTCDRWQQAAVQEEVKEPTPHESPSLGPALGSDKAEVKVAV
jgi:hypothetical protein